jgi:transcriptional regulator with XRE-family HTH domain
MTFVNRLDSLLKAKKLTRKEFLETMKFGKNQITYWEKNNTLPNASTLDAIATFFGVSVEYLTGLEDEESYANRIVGLVIEWLIDNDYEYTEEGNGSVCINKSGECIYLTMSDFATECLAIKKVSENGFELAMLDWVHRKFSPVTEHNFSKQELELVDIYRDLSLSQQIDLITHALKLKNGEK